MAGLLTFGSTDSPRLPGPDAASRIRSYSIIVICYVILKRPSNNRSRWLYFIIGCEFKYNQQRITKLRVLSPNTAAGPYRICTGFPILPKKLFCNHHFLPANCVAICFKILTYLRVRSVFEANCALLPNKIWQFQNSFIKKGHHPIFDLILKFN